MQYAIVNKKEVNEKSFIPEAGLIDNLEIIRMHASALLEISKGNIYLNEKLYYATRDHCHQAVREIINGNE